MGLCEYVQHLSIFDYVCASGTDEGRLTEYADHLHEHFKDPVRIRGGRYVPPVAAGSSVEMWPRSIEDYTFPGGAAWRTS